MFPLYGEKENEEKDQLREKWMITHIHMTPSSGYWNTQIPNINFKNYSPFSETLYDTWVFSKSSSQINNGNHVKKMVEMQYHFVGDRKKYMENLFQ